MEGGDQSIEKKFQLAFRLQQQNKNDKALRIYQEILAQDGTHHDALVNLAALLRKTGRVDTALQLLVRAEELHPNSIIVRFNLGNMYYTSGHYQHAVACYRKCVSMADRMTGFHARLSHCDCALIATTLLSRIGRLAYRKRRECIEKLIARLSPGNSSPASTYEPISTFAEDQICAVSTLDVICSTTCEVHIGTSHPTYRIVTCTCDDKVRAGGLGG